MKTIITITTAAAIQILGLTIPFVILTGSGVILALSIVLFVNERR